jgi:AMP-binding enzyme
VRRRSRLSDEPELANAALDLLKNGTENGRYAFTYVDSIGVIERHRFVEVSYQATLWAELLRRHGLPRGGRVVVLAGRDRHWRSALLGILEAGGVAIPCSTAAPPAVIHSLTAQSFGIVCASPQTDLVESPGVPVLSPENLEPRQRATSDPAALQPTSPHDFALVVHESNASRLRGTAYTHEMLTDQTSSGGSRLGMRVGERMWCTVPEGSAQSLWLTLAAWRLGVELVVAEEELDPGTRLELLDKLQPAAVWFSDEEYTELAGAPTGWVDLSSIRQVMTSGEPGEGAIAFQEVFGLTLAPVPVGAEAFSAAVVPAEGDHANPAAEAPSIRGNDAQNSAKDGRRPDVLAAVELQRRADAAAARAEEEKQREAERARNEKEARQRRQQQAKERKKEEDRLRKKESTLRKLAEQTARADERRRDEEAKRLAKEERQRQEQQAKERQQEDERRRNEEAKQRKLAAQAAREALQEEERRTKREKQREEERLRMEQEARQREEQRAQELHEQQERRRREDAEKRERAAHVEQNRRRDRADQPERERLAPDVISRINQYYGIAAPVIQSGEQTDVDDPNPPRNMPDPDERRARE